MSKKKTTTKASKTKKPSDPLLKKALATTAANIARIEAAERGEKKPAKPAKQKSTKRMSGLDAAARVLTESKKPLNAQDLVAAMATKGYWKSPGGRTPHATLHAAVSREIKLKGKDSRFQKVDRGMFAANR